MSISLPAPRKRFGQHFLRDERILARIVSVANVSGADLVVEIGPGRGALTDLLLAKAGAVAAIELDRDLAEFLRGRYADRRFFLHEGDILKTDLGTVLDAARAAFPEVAGGAVKLVANLPYNVSTPILEKLIDDRERFSTLVVMLQKEVVERIASQPGTKDYGYFSVFLQAFFTIEALFDVPPGAFQPPPKVMSAIARLTPRAVPLVAPAHERRFRSLASLAFSQRRKMLGKTLRGLAATPESFTAAFEQTGIDPTRRPETLTVAEFVRLAEAFGES